MRFRLVGHEYRYAVEQILLSLFPDERPVFSSDLDIGSDELLSESRLSFGTVFAQSVTVIRCGDKVSRGFARVRKDRLSDKLVSDRLLQRIIKQSFYRAAKDFVDSLPVWGSLTGIRPAHIAAASLNEGNSADSVIKKMTREYYVSPERAKMCVRAGAESLALRSTLLPGDIALYVGIPFCPTRCTYCSFVSNSVEKSFGLIEPFVSVLLSEIEMAAETIRTLGLRVTSVYFGGGTPTSLPSVSLEAILSAMQSLFDFSHVREYTFEAGRPDTISEEKLDIIRRYGASRICVNPQSMSDNVLSAIGRKHTARDVIDAAHLVRKSGAAVNMDLIAGLPGDTPDSFRNTVDTVLDLSPEGVTIHTLSLKKGSKIMLEGTKIPDGTDVRLMLDYASQRLTESGLFPYYLYRQKFTSGGFENTGWCLPGHKGVYNICMMEELCTVIALGGGGATKLISADGRIERIFNAKYPREYILFENKLREKYDKILSFVSGEDSPPHKQEVLYAISL